MLAVSVAALAACGGGSPTTTPEKTTGDVTLSGTAATGAAMANATIKVKCATGDKSTTADSKGAYSVTITGASLPCVIEATDGTNTLHSLAEGTGAGTSTANVTPLTEYVLAQVMGSEKTEDIFNSFDSAAQGKLTSSKVAEAVTAIKASFKDVLTIDFDPLKVEFKAAVNGEGGDATDKILDKLLSLAQQDSPEATPKDALKALTKKVVVAGGGAAASLNLAKLPVDNCPAVRNVPYRIITLAGSYGVTASTQWDKQEVVAAWNDSDESSQSNAVAFDAAQPCKYELTPANSNGKKMQGAVAASGVFVMRDPGSVNSEAGLAIGFPAQTIPLADLAGTWNALQYQKEVNNWINKQITFTLDANGNLTNFQNCSGTTQASDTCVAVDANKSPKALVANSKGGFDMVNQSDAKTGNRLFGYRNASGELMMVSTGSNSGSAGPGMLIATKKRTLTLPKVNDVAKIWDIQASVSSSLTLVSSFSASQVTVKSVGSNSATRVRDTVDGAADGREDTLSYNQPRDGLRYRAAGSYTPAGATTPKPISAAVQMPIKDMGLTVTAGTGSDSTGKFLNLSVAMP
ncbi:hypothetical protein B9Z51_11190 [Limnohabitans sp. T6-5]|nr:hypothetical protein B9Z51_11190 [Limnohabitans sp. T6-5]